MTFTDKTAEQIGTPAPSAAPVIAPDEILAAATAATSLAAKSSPNGKTKPERSLDEIRAAILSRKVCLSNRPPLPQACIFVELDGKKYKWGTLGSFSDIKGQKKAGKSLACISITAAAISGQKIGPFVVEPPDDRRRVLYFDTEQGAGYSALAQEKIAIMLGLPINEDLPNLEYFDLRPLGYQDRFQFIDDCFKEFSDTFLVVVDGVADITPDTNDLKEAMELSGHLLRWTQQSNCHLLGIIHENKNGTNSRGHAGGEIERKTENQTSVEKSKDGDSFIYTIRNEDMRGMPTVPPFAFRIDERGLPVFDDVAVPEKKTAGRRREFEPNSLPLEAYREMLKNILQRTPAPTRAQIVSEIRVELAASTIKAGKSKSEEVLDWLRKQNLVVSPPQGKKGYSFNLA